MLAESQKHCEQRLLLLFGGNGQFTRLRWESGNDGVSTQASEFSGNLLGRQDLINAASDNGMLRHLGEKSGVLLLSKRDAAFRLDLLQSDGPVRSRPREQHADRTRAAFMGQGEEKGVNGKAPTMLLEPGEQPEYTVFEGHVRVRWDHIDMVWFQNHPLLSFQHW